MQPGPLQINNLFSPAGLPLWLGNTDSYLVLKKTQLLTENRYERLRRLIVDKSLPTCRVFQFLVLDARDFNESVQARWHDMSMTSSLRTPLGYSQPISGWGAERFKVNS